MCPEDPTIVIDYKLVPAVADNIVGVHARSIAELQRQISEKEDEIVRLERMIFEICEAGPDERLRVEMWAVHQRYRSR